MPSLPDLARPALAWFREHQRPYPWRLDPRPYPVLVSEFMLQQTRVETVIPYFERWMAALPGFAALAAAPIQQVLSLWEGLGYYRRAHNLHRLARVLVAEYRGELPADPAALLALPGIGRYTAGAVASIAFGRDTPAVDGNVKRLLARFFAVDEPIDRSPGEQRIWSLAAAHLPPGRAGDYNQALMGLGSRVCLPRNPSCGSCPLQAGCTAHASGRQSDLPRRSPRAAVPQRNAAAAVIIETGSVLLRRRPDEGLLAGLWEFPNVPLSSPRGWNRSLAEGLLAEHALHVETGQNLPPLEQAYSHFKLRLHPCRCRLLPASTPLRERPGWRWVPLVELAALPMSRIDRRLAQRLLESQPAA